MTSSTIEQNDSHYLLDYDFDGDGKLSSVEAPSWAQNRDYFGRLDADDDGFLTADDLPKVTARIVRIEAANAARQSDGAEEDSDSSKKGITTLTA